MTNRKEASSFRADRLAQIALVAGGLLLGAEADVALGQDIQTQTPLDPRVVEMMGNYVITPQGMADVINYLQFNLSAGRTVEFTGMNGFRLLNRVVELNPSIIEGMMFSNTPGARVYLVNPAGVSFVNGQVNMPSGAFYAVAGDMNPDDFMDGTERFNPDGQVLVDGGSVINARDIYLIGKTIENAGTITGSGGGLIAMVTGNNDVMIQQLGTRITVTVDSAVLVDDGDFGDPTRPPFFGTTDPSMGGTAQIRNSGVIRNFGGRTFLGAGDIGSFAFHNTLGGVIEDTAGGQIDVRAVDGLALNDGAIESSADFFGGRVTFKAPSVINNGTITADGGSGEVVFFGHDHAYLTSGSRISARSGQVRVGSFDNLGLTILQGTSGLTTGATVDVSGSGGLVNIFGPSFIMNGNILADGGTAVLNVSGNGQTLRVSDVRMDDMLDLTPASSRPMTGYVLASSLLDATGAISLDAARDIEINSTITLDNNNDVFLLSRNGNIFINAEIIGARDLTARAPGTGTIFVRVPLDLEDDAFFEALAITLEGGSIVTGGTQQYDGDVFLGSEMSLEGTEITFFNEVASRNGGFHTLMIDADLTTFNGRVGGDGTPGQLSRHLESLFVMGATQLNTESVRTNGSQQFFGPVMTAGDATFVSRLNGDIEFGDTLDGSGALDVETGGTTIFRGAVGTLSPFDSITTDAGGQTLIAANILTGTLTFGDGVVMGTDATITATTEANFNSTITGDGNDLNIVSPITNFRGDVAGLDTLSTDAVGVTNIDTGSVQARVINFGDDVVAMQDTSIRGNDRLNFDQTLNGGVNVRVGSDTLVRFGGNVGDTTALASLRIDSGGTGQINDNPIVVEGSLIQTVGDILINPDGRSVPALVATLAAMGNVVIKSQTGNIFVGANEKLTSLANLTIMANNGIATLNDLNAVNSISVMAASIIFRARAAGTLLDFLGNTITDRGMEVIAGDSIFMSTNPQVIGNGAPPVFATRSGTNITGVAGQFSLRSIGDLTAQQFRLNPVLDLTLQSDSDLAPAFDNGLQFGDRVLLDPVTSRSLAAIGLNVRPFTTEDLLATVGGNQIVVDTRRGGLTPDEPGITANRLRRKSVERVLAIHERIFLPVPPLDSPEAEAEFQRRLAGRREQVRSVIAAAWDDYTAGGARDDNPAGFRTYMAQSGKHSEALLYVHGLEDIFRELWIMGATPLDMQNCEEMVLVPVCPDAINPATFRQAVGTDLIG